MTTYLSNVKVNILTFCKGQSSFYGNSLIFKTLRVGFPNAEIFVYDNASPHLFSEKIKVLSEENDCHFARLETEINHHAFIDTIISNNKDNEDIVFLDPDLCFWENCENWRFDSLLAGRLIPRFYDEFSGCITHPRVHTSFLWVPKPKELLGEINKLIKFEYQPFQPYMYFLENKWFRYDTLSSLYSVFNERIKTFNEKELNSYDHLFCGTHLDLVKDYLNDDGQLNDIHDKAKKDYKLIKGIWREQEKHFTDRSI